MGLNIKNERVCSLAKDAARRTGQTQTGVIATALEEYLRRLQEQADDEQRRADEAEAARQRLIDEIVADFDRHRIDGPSGEEIIASLYDPATGLPA
ncbi:MAG TPA: type II toxin-antitoxin system VapB family antitoxin [Phycicoccus sp.]|nr:type II toxin-antitoxin system VapB family antitoxin [Phycicoccus sp.]